MRYVTSVERIGMKKEREEGIQVGKQDGLLSGIELGSELRFGDTGLELLPEIREIEDAEMLENILQSLKMVNCPEALRQVYQPSQK